MKIIALLGLAFLLLAVPRAAYADAVVTFYAKNFLFVPHGYGRAGQPGHAFIRIQGIVAGSPVDEYYGFFPKDSHRTMSVIKLVPSEVRKLPESSQTSFPHVSKTVDDATYADIKRRITAWEAPASEYNLWIRNCTDFTADLARAVGLNVGDTTGVRTSPDLFMKDLAERNPENVRTSAHPDRRLTDEEFRRVMKLFDYHGMPLSGRGAERFHQNALPTLQSRFNSVEVSRGAALSANIDAREALRKELFTANAINNQVLAGETSRNEAELRTKMQAAVERVRGMATPIRIDYGSGGGPPSHGESPSCGDLCLQADIPVSAPRVVPTDGAITYPAPANSSPTAPTHESYEGPLLVALGTTTDVAVSQTRLVVNGGAVTFGESGEFDLYVGLNDSQQRIIVVDAFGGLEVESPRDPKLPTGAFLVRPSTFTKLKVRFRAPADMAQLKAQIPPYLTLEYRGVVQKTIFVTMDVYPHREVEVAQLSEWLPSGYAKAWSETYSLCTGLNPVGFTLVSLIGNVKSAEHERQRRDCQAVLGEVGSSTPGWTKCQIEDDRIAGQCFKFSAQGHQQVGIDAQMKSLSIRGVLTARYRLSHVPARWLTSQEVVGGSN
jgi:hypothetical protein